MGRPDGLSPLCAMHQALAERESIRKLKQQAVELLGGRCERCGYDIDARAFQFDHRNGGGGVERKSIGAQRTLYKKILADPSPYALLCANCNQIKRIVDAEHGTRTYERVRPTEKRSGIGRGNAAGQRAALRERTPEQEQKRRSGIAASRTGSKLVDGHWVGASA